MLAIDETGSTKKLPGQTFKVAWYCVRKRVDPKETGDVERDPTTGGADEMDVWPSPLTGRGSGGDPSQQLGGDGGEAFCSEISKVLRRGWREIARTLPLPPLRNCRPQLPCRFIFRSRVLRMMETVPA